MTPNFRSYQAVLLDCDGLVLDSNAIKTDAFYKTLAIVTSDEDKKQAFIDYHKYNGGISRYEKYKYLFSNILKLDFSQSTYDLLLSEFSKFCLEGYQLCNTTHGCVDFLNKLKSAQIDTFIVSGGDQNELQNVFKTNGLGHYFKGIFGSPVKKPKHINIIKQDYDKVLFMGDSIKDLEAAHETNSDFIGISNYSEDKKALIEGCSEYQYPCFEFLSDLL